MLAIVAVRVFIRNPRKSSSLITLCGREKKKRAGTNILKEYAKTKTIWLVFDKLMGVMGLGEINQKS